MIQSVLFINPPSLPGTTANREGTAGMGVTVSAPRGFYYPPQTLAYGIAVLREAGYLVGGVDAVGQDLSLPATLVLLRDHVPDLFVVHVTPQTWDADVRFLQALRGDFPHIPVLLIGTAAHFIPHARWSPWATALLAGDAEWGLVQAVRALPDQQPAAGLWYAHTSTPPAPVRIPHHPTLPRPAWDALPTDVYPFLSLWGSRGCEHTCAWCPYRLGWGDSRRVRDPQEVAEELVWLAQTFGKPRHIFRDPLFAAQPEWVRTFCRELTRRASPPPPWEVEDRPEHLTPDLLHQMARAGCTQVKLGLEIISPSLLVRWHRVPDARAAQAYIRAAAQAIRTCRKEGILCRAFVLTGIGETEEELAATEAFIQEHKPHYVSVKRFVPYPGLPSPPELSLPEERLRAWEERLQAHTYPPRPSWRHRLRRIWS